MAKNTTIVQEVTEEAAPAAVSEAPTARTAAPRAASSSTTSSTPATPLKDRAIAQLNKTKAVNAADLAHRADFDTLYAANTKIFEEADTTHYWGKVKFVREALLKGRFYEQLIQNDIAELTRISS